MKYKVPPIEQVEVEDPFTHEKRIVSLDRTGHTEQKLIVALANPELTRDRKDHALSMYLYERGAENVSMIVDLMRYKGAHTKESRIFQSRVRYDYQTFVDTFTRYLENQARLIGVTLGVDIKEEKGKFEKWLELPDNKGKGYGFAVFYGDYYRHDWDAKTGFHATQERLALIELAIHAIDEAETLRSAIQRITNAREAEQGGGIYLDRKGQAYSVNDPQLEDIIKADRAIKQEAEKL